MIPEGVIPVTIVVFFALIGIVTVCVLVSRWWMKGRETLRNFNFLIVETRDFLKEHRQDLRAAGQLREMFAAAQEPPTPNFGPQSAPDDGKIQQRSEIPKPLWEMFKTAPPEPDAPSEAADVSPTEEELFDEDKADQLEKMGLGRPDPEFRPRAVEVDSE